MAVTLYKSGFLKKFPALIFLIGGCLKGYCPGCLSLKKRQPAILKSGDRNKLILALFMFQHIITNQILFPSQFQLLFGSEFIYYVNQNLSRQKLDKYRSVYWRRLQVFSSMNALFFMYRFKFVKAKVQLTKKPENRYNLLKGGEIYEGSSK